MSQAFAKIHPIRRVVETPPAPTRPKSVQDLTGRQKAAVIVRLLLAEGAPLPLAALPEHMQAAIAEQIGHMRLVDRTTLTAIVEEFVTELEEVGLAFPGGIEGALTIMDGHISATAAHRLRRLAGASAKADPWDRIVGLDLDRLLPVVEEESIEVAAVMLSKLPVPKAAELLGKLPGEKARRVAYAVSLTGNVDPETVRRIGNALLTQLDNSPPRAFETDPVERVGAILDVATSDTREEVLRGLAEQDADFAEQVRRAIFTFDRIPARIAPRDVPRIVRQVDKEVLVTAMAGVVPGPQEEAVEFILGSLPGRLADSLRDEIALRGQVREKEADAAMQAIIAAIRELEAAGDISMIVPEE